MEWLCPVRKQTNKQTNKKQDINVTVFTDLKDQRKYLPESKTNIV